TGSPWTGASAKWPCAPSEAKGCESNAGLLCSSINCDDYGERTKMNNRFFRAMDAIRIMTWQQHHEHDLPQPKIVLPLHVGNRLELKSPTDLHETIGTASNVRWATVGGTKYQVLERTGLPVILGYDANVDGPLDIAYGYIDEQGEHKD